MAQTRKSGFHISYVTITYKSVLLGAVGVAVLAGIVTYLAFPGTAGKLMRSAENILEKGLEKAGFGANPSASNSSSEPGQRQAHFTAIDGNVKVKKRGTSHYQSADYTLALEKGDVIQTESEGLAKIVFTDGTSYMVKPDSLIVVQENSIDAAQQTSVAVTVTTGTVGVNTPTIKGKSEVFIAGANFNVGSQTSAVVRNDPRSDNHEILITKGSGVVTKDGQEERLGENEKASFKQDSPGIAKSKEIGPPTLIEPANMEPVSLVNESQAVSFSWSEMAGAKAYRIRISRNIYFTTTVLDQQVEGTQVQLSGFPEGPYYWEVQSVGPNGKRSIESERNKFQVIFKRDENASILLVIDSVVLHGRVVELNGHTEVGARVIVNGQIVPVESDGTFHHFTGAMPTGENMITVTAQNTKGGSSTKPQKVTIY